MKFILRILGTWFLGLALVLVIIDGAKTLAANAIVITPLANTWNELHAASWATVSSAITGAFEGLPAGPDTAEYLFSVPAWGIFTLFGVIFLLLGRQRSTTTFVATY